MSDKDRANELNTRLGGVRARRNVSTLDKNVRAIERLVNAAADRSVGLISVYRPLDEEEKRALQPLERDEIANAYHVETAGDDRVRYITYKPRVEQGAGGALEHVNRSTPFVQSLLEKVSNEYSFLYCHSKVRACSVPLPPAASGFAVQAGETEHLEGKNKYELFFLIECKDNIDAGERIGNIIDSVLLDVDGESGDFFARMSYASLTHEDAEDEEDMPFVEPAVQSQLNDIILQIRESPKVRERIVDFLAGCEQSELHAFLAARNEAFVRMREVSPQDINAFNSTVTCRVLPIGVFLNAIDNDRIPYTVTGKNGERAVFYTELNPAAPFSAHVCPHCGAALTPDNGVLAASTREGYRVGCEKCASRCAHKNCKTYAFDSQGCAVCHKILCPAHSLPSADSLQSLCRECARVFRDPSGAPLAPSDAAVRGEEEFYVRDNVERLGKTGALNMFKTVKLLRKSLCVLCKTAADRRAYYLKNETADCPTCGEHYLKTALKKTRDTGEKLCDNCRLDCACGNVVAKKNAHMCAADGCERGFCEKCFAARQTPKGYAAAVKRMGQRKAATQAGDALLCNEHVAVCKVCGVALPKNELRVCPDCGGGYCASCERDGKCRTCAAADTVTAENYKSVSSRTRRMRLNALPLRDRLGKTAVIEDHETVVFVTLPTVPLLRLSAVKRVHHKLTGKTEVIRK